MNNAYLHLGISPDATIEEIERAYEIKKRLYEPSRFIPNSPEQQEAADRIIEYFHLLDEIRTNPETSVQPLADITTGQTQDLDLKDIDEYRSKGWVQKGVFTTHIKGAAEPVDVDGARMVQVQVCTDGKDTDLVDAKTGESTVNPTRPRYLLWDMQVVNPATVWLIGDATNEIVGGC